MSRLPSRKELRRIEQSLQQRIASQPVALAALQTAVRQHLRKPVGWAARISDLHPRLSTRAKGEIVLANLIKRQFPLERLVYRALALEEWSKTRFNGVPQHRQRFVATQVGKLAIRNAKLSSITPGAGRRRVSKNLSGTVAAQVGLQVIQAVRAHLEHPLEH